MKLKVLLIAAGCSMGMFGAYAQKGVDNGTQFGSGEDSIRCITNISLFGPYAKAGNYKDALEFWKIAYNECPAATKDIYLYGVRIVGWQIQNEKDPAKRMALINDLMGVYDKRVKYFGNDRRYGKDWIISRKAQDYIQYMGENADYNVVYNWLNEIVNEKGNDTETLGVSLFAFSALQKMLADPNFKEQYIQDYLKASAILESQLKAAQAAGNTKDIDAITTIKGGIDNSFANSGAADCETLQNMYAQKVEENKDNLDYLKDVISLLRRVRCQEIDAYFAASAYAYKQEPSAEAAIGIAKQAVKAKDYDKAIKYFEEAANMETDNAAKADDYYMIALLCFEQNSYSKARQYCQKAIELNPNYGAPYLMIGKMYAATAKSVYPNDGVLSRAVYYAAIDKFEKAKQVDPSIAEEANGLINTYRAHLPSTEEIFMHPDLEKGKPFTVGGWIGERTTVR
ncbi:tetratricopeptide repeat protein [Parabacteroides bouchesdurhonensis]|uniref:tetratricopeptide repeat protein n=1 Tax=Parabacteroides bouchesdurhonensis TaxID=1936995 RepID=UPI000C857512|nr:tetratricopeptide repeat protein [Parabacteroides bouchesdurhonensis]RHJ95332.1 tetratricopeptide repeat protein [Bacteroides sp. AM07-16]